MTVLAVLASVYGIIQLGSGIAVLSGYGDVPAATNRSVIGSVALVQGLITLVIGYGLWSLRNWVRILTLAVAALNIAVGIVVWASGAAPLWSALITALVNGAIFFYMVQPHVAAAFIGKPYDRDTRMAA